jgi:MFS family permease
MLAPPKAFQPYDRIGNRTFLGFLLAEFLAAFNDQCIHASAMFFAINSGAMTPDKAISVMPILFYSPWAIFCTLSGYFADKYSKRYSLIFWKVAEVFITALALLGFWLGSTQGQPVLGSYIVLACVFLMGTHSAFYVPCKYGVLPEIFPPHLLSRANGFVESTSFLAVILGTTAGGILAYVFKGQEYGIGIFLVISATIGTLSSFLIEKMPAIDPDRPFPGWVPWKLYAPLVTNLRTMFKSRPLALALLGIAFFTFMVAYMRATMYMHGESQNPPWEEFKISLVVGVVALGIGLGSPLAGYLSGGKVELGLVPIGAVGIIVMTCLASWSVAAHTTLGLVLAIGCTGFFAGFYIVPLYTLFQHRAPKQSKGTMVATSNAVNVTGAILAQLAFGLIVALAHQFGVSDAVPTRDVVAGTLTERLPNRSIEVVGFSVQPDDPQKPTFHIDATRSANPVDAAALAADLEHTRRSLPQMLWDVFADSRKQQFAMVKIDSGIRVNDPVIVGTYTIKNRATGADLVYYRIRPAGTQAKLAYDDQDVPVFLFVVASLMAFMTLTLLCWRLPDFFVRTMLWSRSVGRYHIKVVNAKNLPSEAAAILATNVTSFAAVMHIVAATDRTVRPVVWPETVGEPYAPFLRFLARRTGLLELPHPMASPMVDQAARTLSDTLRAGEVIALSGAGSPEFAELLGRVQRLEPTPVVPIFCKVYQGEGGAQRVRVLVGETLPADTTAEEVDHAVRRLDAATSAIPDDILTTAALKGS